MKRIFILLLVFFLSGCGAVGTSKVYVKPELNKEDIKRIGISRFEGINGESISDLFAAEIKKLGKFEVIERSQIAAVLNEISSGKGIFMPLLSEGLVYDLGTLKEVSKSLGIDSILVGSTSKSYSALILNARLVDAKTGNLLWSSEYNIDSRNLIYISQADFEGAVKTTVKKFQEALITGDLTKPNKQKQKSAKSIPINSPKPDKQETAGYENKTYVYTIGMTKEAVYNIFGKKLEKSYHNEGNEEWVTFDNILTKKKKDTVTFYLKDGKVESWLEVGGGRESVGGGINKK